MGGGEDLCVLKSLASIPVPLYLLLPFVQTKPCIQYKGNFKCLHFANQHQYTSQQLKQIAFFGT